MSGKFVDGNNLKRAIDYIKDGTIIAGKAENDKDGNEITSTYAKKDGNYPTMTVGQAIEAESIKTALGVLDNTPFSCQASGGDADITSGYQKLNKLVGVKVVDNQLNSIPNGTISSSVTNARAANVIGGHTYLLIQKLSRASNGTSTDYQTLLRFNDATIEYGYNAKPFEIRNITSSGILRFGYAIYSSFASNVDYEWYVIDITQRYGNDEIVNAIIGNDSSKYVERLLKFDSNVLKNIAYNTGSYSKCKSAKLKSNKFNQWDEQWELGGMDIATGEYISDNTRIRCKNYQKCIGNTQYYCSNPIGDNMGMYIAFYDGNYNWISTTYRNNQVATTPQDACYFRFIMTTIYGTTYHNDICINFHYDGSRDGEYEASDIMYVDLPNQDLNGILRVDGSGNVYADGDELYPNGVGNSQKYYKESITIASMYTTSGNENYDFAIFTVTNSWGSLYNLRTTRNVSYNGHSNFATVSIGNDLLVYSSGSKQLAISVPKGTTKTQAEALFNGMEVIYELATPQELSASTFAENIYQDDFGLTQVLDEDNNELNGLQGFEIFYKANVVAFTEMLYNKTDGDSDNLALKSDVSAEETTRASQDTILQNAIGGTLRQCLCVKESLSFNNTNVVDLGTLNWSLLRTNTWFVNFNLIKGINNESTSGLLKLLTTKYAQSNCTDSIGTDRTNNTLWCYVANNPANCGLVINDTTFVGNTSKFKEYLSGVLLAYEKASE